MRAAFRSSLDFRDLNHGSSSQIKLLLLKRLIYDSALLGSTIVVPAKFVTDLASIPQVLWNILPPIGAYDAAAVVHDFLYLHNGVTRAQADGVLLEAMEALEVVEWKRRAIYAGVRLGGWVPWNGYRADDDRKATYA